MTNDKNHENAPPPHQRPPYSDEEDSDVASPSHQRAPYSDPLAEGVDPTSPGAPHEPDGTDYHQSDVEEHGTPDSGTANPDRGKRHRAR